MWRCACVLLLLPVLSCTKSNPAASCKTGTCVDSAYPYCDVEGTISGEPGSCIAVTCTPGEVVACVVDDSLRCTDDGAGYEHVPCDLGCVDTPSPHCAFVEPRYLPDVCNVPAVAESLQVTSSGTFDPQLDSNCNGGVVEQTGAPTICVLRYQTITIAEGNTLRIMDSVSDELGRAVALVADADLVVAGTLDISADRKESGPGGGYIRSGGPALADATVNVDATGGGGAGGKSAGAPGGSPTIEAGAANGGAVAADPAYLAALIGGAAAFLGDSGSPLNGGGGGGGATLISCRGSVTVSGVINAGGGGGAGGGFTLGGGGGGAGGYVVLQAKSIEVTGQVFANGGGGGAGMRAAGGQGEFGQNGTASATQAALGGSAQDSGGHGGNGGVGITAPTGGGTRTGAATPGGGGGSVGFFQTYTPAGRDPVLTPSAASPAFQPNGVIRTR